MKCVARVAAMLLGLSLLSAATAGAADPRVPLGDLGTVQLDGYCDFPVAVTYTRSNEYFIHQSVAPDGTTTLKIAGLAWATATNQVTGASVSYTISGPGTIVIFPDGSVTIDAGGPNLLWTLPENSYPGVTALSFTTGHIEIAVDANGLTTGYTLRGRQTDVCAVLAG